MSERKAPDFKTSQGPWTCLSRGVSLSLDIFLLLDVFGIDCSLIGFNLQFSDGYFEISPNFEFDDLCINLGKGNLVKFC